MTRRRLHRALDTWLDHLKAEAERRSLLATLTPAQREVLILRLVDGLSAMETAAVSGMSPATVRLTQHRALNLLRRHLDHPPRSG